MTGESDTDNTADAKHDPEEMFTLVTGVAGCQHKYPKHIEHNYQHYLNDKRNKWIQ